MAVMTTESLLARHEAHEEYRVERDGQSYMRHECGICPHGRFLGADVRLRDGVRIDGMERKIKLHAIDQLRCAEDHPNLPALDEDALAALVAEDARLRAVEGRR